MAITIERKPHVVVTDQQSGWSLMGGRSDGDGASTKEMSHVSGARCTVNLRDDSKSDAELALQITGVLYLNPGESKGRHVLKEPDASSSINARELYAVAEQLIRAWYEATFAAMPPLTIKLPIR